MNKMPSIAIVTTLIFVSFVTLITVPNGDSIAQDGTNIVRSYDVSTPIEVEDTTNYEATFGGHNLIEMPNGDWLSVYYVGTWHVSEDGRVNGSISSDYGVTWGESFNIVDTEFVDDRNPSVFVNGSRIIVHYGQHDNVTQSGIDSYAVYSDDNATTWSESIPMWLNYELSATYAAPILEDGGFYLPYYAEQWVGPPTTKQHFVSLTSSSDGITYGERTQLLDCDSLTDWSVEQGANSSLSLSDDYKEGTKSIEFYGGSVANYLRISYVPVAPLDLSDYDGLTLWFKQNVSTATTLYARVLLLDSSGYYTECWGWARPNNWSQYAFPFSLPTAVHASGPADLTDIVKITIGLSRSTAYTGAFWIDDICGTNWDTTVVSSKESDGGGPTELTVAKAQDKYIGVWRDSPTHAGWISYSDDLSTWATPIQLLVNGSEDDQFIESPSLTTINNITILSYREVGSGARYVYSYGGYVWEGKTNVSGAIYAGDGYATVVETPTGAYILYYFQYDEEMNTGIYGQQLAFSDIGGRNRYWLHSVSEGTIVWDRDNSVVIISDYDSTTVSYGVGANGTMPFINITFDAPSEDAQAIGFSYPVSGIATFVFSDLMEWTTDCSSSTTFSYTVSGLDSELGYRIYQDSVVIATGIGPSFSFSAIGGGDFEIVEWYGKQVSGLIVLTVNMVGLGIIVAVLASYIAPIANDIKEKRPIKPEKLTQNLIRTVIFIVVASLMWGVLHSVAIG